MSACTAWRTVVGGRRFSSLPLSALQGLTATAFDIRFDEAVAFNPSSRFDNERFPIVLLADAISRDFVIDLWVSLGRALGRSVDKSAEHVLPHITVAYSPDRIARQAIDPIGWRVDEVVLVRSFVGQTRHVVIHRQPLCRPN
ncbi:MAG: 2-5 ligase [Caulobacter sp.]|nr:2-5 ligase [Caulobacter sp.]